MKKSFDGTYYKIADGKNAVAAIFEKSGFTQAITKDGSFCPAIVDFSGILFGELAPIKYDAMGPFRFFPFMECKHKVISMSHSVDGQIRINDKAYDFKNARGYTEGDSGRSFPKKYFWSQCNTFDDIKNLSVMASCAIVPYLGLKFTGTICIIHLGGREYRLATYLGARVKEFGDSKLVIKQGFGKRRKILEVNVADPDKNMHELIAPQDGNMNRIIRESIVSTVHYKFLLGKNTVFDTTSNCAAYEYSMLT